MTTRADHALNGAYLRLRAQLVDLQQTVTEGDTGQIEALAEQIERDADVLVRHLRRRVDKARRKVPHQPCTRERPAADDAVVRDAFGHLSRRHPSGLWGADTGATSTWDVLWSLRGPLEVVGTYPKMTAPLWPDGLTKRSKRHA